MKKSVLVLGGGAWGTAVATVLAHNGHAVALWCREPKVAATINHERQNSRYLPGVSLPANLVATADLEQACSSVAVIFEAVPVSFLRDVLIKIKPFFRNDQLWVLMSKGIEKNSSFLPSDILDDVMDAPVDKVILGGPNFASVVARKEFSGTVLASPNSDRALLVQALLENEYFKPVISHDMVGVQVAGALKNVIALGVGVITGTGHGPNAAAFVITQGLREMAELTHALGGERESLFGLAGIGDLILTATGEQSRNLRAGVMLGNYKSLGEIEQTMGVLPEGVNTCASLEVLMHREAGHGSRGLPIGVSLPFCAAVCDLVAGQLSVDAFVHKVLR